MFTWKSVVSSCMATKATKAPDPSHSPTLFVDIDLVQGPGHLGPGTLTTWLLGLRLKGD